jgi:hypothetical protein
MKRNAATAVRKYEAWSSRNAPDPSKGVSDPSRYQYDWAAQQAFARVVGISHLQLPVKEHVLSTVRGMLSHLHIFGFCKRDLREKQIAPEKFGGPKLLKFINCNRLIFSNLSEMY